IYEPAADGQVQHGCDEPGDARVNRGVQQVNVVRGREIAGKPGEEEIEAVIVRGEAERESPDAALAQEISEGRALFGFGAIFWLCATALDVGAFGRAERFVF